MKQFSYVIKDAIGLHARPAGLLVKEAKKYHCSIMVEKGEKIANALRLMALMGLGVKCGDTVFITVDGEGEEEAAMKLQDFFEKNL